jgi:hypothetical protein
MQSETKRLGLLDFAAARQFSPNASVRLLCLVACIPRRSARVEEGQARV